MLPVELVCPRCKGGLAASSEAYTCGRCPATYPIIAGIPDLRVTPDPWISLEEDREKGLRLFEAARSLGFEETVRAYWAMTPTTPRAFAERFTAHVLRAEARSREWLAHLRSDAPPGFWLDLGCGTADLAAASAHDVISIDVAFRWLIVARKRLEASGRPAYLVCANAEQLPFSAERFTRVLSLGLLEHCRDLDRVLPEAARVLSASGEIQLRTVNRFSLLPEPHVGVWGVGFVPRRWADPYVQWRSGQRYLHHFPVGRRRLKRGLLHAGFEGVSVEAARLLAAELPSELQPLAPWYERMRRQGILGRALVEIAPLLDATGRKLN